MITNERLERINRERRQKRLRPLTLAQASSAEYHNRDKSSDDLDSMLMGFTTGMIVGPNSMIGAELHNAVLSDPIPIPDIAPSPDSGSSSPSSDAGSPSTDSSSPSTDSGGTAP